MCCFPNESLNTASLLSFPTEPEEGEGKVRRRGQAPICCRQETSAGATWGRNRNTSAGFWYHHPSWLGEGEAMRLPSSSSRGFEAPRRKVTPQLMAAERKGPFSGHLTAGHKKLTAESCLMFIKKSFICPTLVLERVEQNSFSLGHRINFCFLFTCLLLGF